jgi:hypothetical protein
VQFIIVREAPVRGIAQRARALENLIFLLRRPQSDLRRNWTPRRRRLKSPSRSVTSVADAEKKKKKEKKNKKDGEETPLVLLASPFSSRE